MKSDFHSNEGFRKSKHKIAWISLLFYDFGNIISQTEILKCLAKRNNDVHFVALRSKRRKTQIYPDIDTTFIPVRFAPIIATIVGTLVLVFYLPFYMLKKRPDYVITSSSTSMFGWLTKLFPHPLKPKVILDIRSTPIRVKGTFREYLHTIMFRVSVVLAKKKFDGMTTLTQLMKKAICYNFDINPNFVGVWTSGVSTEFFVLNKYDAKQLRRELGLENKFIVFYHGALSKARGIGETIKSVKILKTRHDDIVLFLLGTGTGVQELMKIAEETGVQDKVIVHGWVNYSEVPKYIAMCDVAIVPLPDSPNWRYQCPLKLLEYLAMNKVAIVTDIPANRAIVGKCKCGIVVPSANPQEIAKAIEYAYVNRKKLNEWGGCGRALVEKSYSWEKIAKDFENYLLSL